MSQHLIWTAGLAGHVVLAAVLLSGGRVRRFPLFTSLIFFEIIRTLVSAFVLSHLTHHAFFVAATTLDASGIFLAFATLAELITNTMATMDRFPRIILSLLLLASGGVIVLLWAPVRPFTGQDALLLLHFLLSVLFVEWIILLLLLFLPLRMRWYTDAFAISLGFGAYSAILIFAAVYFRVAREMHDFIFFSNFRIAVYLAVLLWWIFALSASSYHEKRIRSQAPAPL